jgi:hypothetical protein
MNDATKAILMGGGIILIGLGLILGFLTVVYGLKEDDEDLFLYLTIPLGMCAFGSLLIYNARNGRKN